jgi:16S rRNA (cytidine1402-2'-O)-methyltransferase
VGEPRASLWIVATPIGTLQDLGARACELLGQVDVIFAEDTRRARRLLSHAGIRSGGRLRSLHEHNEARRIPDILAALKDGRSVALLSDAGTPVLSDPGYQVVRAVREQKLPVCSVPGPSAFTAALAAAGQPPLPAILVGFLPARTGARRRRLRELTDWQHTMVVFLSPHRLAVELADLADVMGEGRPATLLAELSKVHERGLMAQLGELVTSEESASPRGEYVLVIGPSAPCGDPTSDVTSEQVRDHYVREVAGGADRRQAMQRTAAALGISRRVVFDALVDFEKRAEE